MTDAVDTPVISMSAPVPGSNPDLRWYVVHAYSGMEKAVERNILERITRSGMQDKFGRILVPMEEVVEVKNGQKRTTERKMKIVNQMQEGTDKPRHKIEFVVGEFVRVKEGPFADFNGSVEDVNYEKSKVRVAVTIFGRSTPVELEFSQIEKT